MIFPIGRNVIIMELYDRVRIKIDDLEHGVREGFTGTIIDVYVEDKAFTVEFEDEDGDSIADSVMAVYYKDDLELVASYRW